MEHDWALVAARYFRLHRCELSGHLKHRKDHYVLRAKGDRWLLSTARLDDRRLPLDWQFIAIQALSDAGFEQVRLPEKAVDGSLYALHQTNWWTLRCFTPGDRRVDWEDDAVVTDAAGTLAAMHDAAGRARPTLSAAVRDPDSLDPFHWSVDDVLHQLDKLLRHFRARHDREQTRSLGRAVERLTDDAPAIVREAYQHGLVGLTHQDFRRANLRVHQRRIKEVWDWDLARVDHTLYDVAFGCLQFMGQDCLGAPAGWERRHRPVQLALGFVREYVARTPQRLRELVPRLLPWYLRYAIVKRILVGNSTYDRLALLRQVERSPLVNQAAITAALEGEQPVARAAVIVSDAS